MTLNSISYFIFLPIVYTFFYFSPPKYKWLALLLASYLFCFFYSLKVCLILLLTSSVNFIGGKFIFKNRDNEKLQKYILYGFVAANIIILGIFKYLGFILDNINLLLRSVKAGQIDVIYILAPVGISYYILQGISYLVDIFWDDIESEKEFGYFLLYMAFFPKFMMGPVERADDLLRQLKDLHLFKFDYYSTKSGFLLIVWGLFQKFVLANRLAILVNRVYDNPVGLYGLPSVLATIMYTFQLYYDFSGYTNIALGTGRLFNITLSQNFNHPFFVSNIQDFWRKWHMSFSFWIQDYLFAPMRMRYRALKKVGLFLSVFITFCLVGLWHEAMWTFVMFGIVHGIYMSISTLTLRKRNKFWKEKKLINSAFLIYTRRITTFLMVCFSMIFVRANSISDAFIIIKNIAYTAALKLNLSLTMQLLSPVSACLLICLGELIHLMQRRDKINALFFESPMWLRWSVYYATIIFIALFGEFSTKLSFIYVQF